MFLTEVTILGEMFEGFLVNIVSCSVEYFL
jgi:hypothetical protein